LIDQYQIVVKPLVLGRGKTSRAFGNGNVLLSYAPMA
jgi:hypothetical protein